MLMSKHPQGLPVLFMTEVWERFGFYIVQGMMILYMTQYLGFSDAKSAGVLGGFTALAYIMPVLGGLLADKIYGFRPAVLMGGGLLIIGYALLGAFGERLLYISLAVIVIGTGFFKPNVSSLVGSLYEGKSEKRDAGYTIFYVGINLGIFIATATSGFVQRLFGWNITFSMASVGLIVGVITFIVGRPKLNGAGEPPKYASISRVAKILKKPWVLLLTILIAVGLSALLMLKNSFANLLFTITGIILVSVLTYASFEYEKTVRNKMIAMLVLTAAAVMFWAVFFQMFFATNLFIERVVDRTIFGFEIPTVAFISFEPLFIFMFGPFFAILWHKLAKRKKNPKTPTKFTTSLFITSFGFLMLAAGIHFRDVNGKISPLWVVIGYLFITIGELLLSPIGLSAVIKLSPPKMVGLMTGVFFFSLGYGGSIAGALAKRASISEAIQNNIFAMGDVYHNAFLLYAKISVAVGIALLILLPILLKMVGEETPV